MKEYLTVMEVAELLQVTPSTIYQWSRERQLRVKRVNRKLFIDEDSLEAFIRRNRQYRDKFYSKP
jgi:excisionase family DNA binding protein